MIKRDRNRVEAPHSLSEQEALDEFNTIKALVDAHESANVTWADTMKLLKFEAYKKQMDVKQALVRLFGAKCAYCERSLYDEDIHIEHFRPKKEVDNKDRADGKGYWWLAASWTNLLPSCGHCNRSPGRDPLTGQHYGSGKGTRFPLLPGSVYACNPGEEVLEEHILINPAEEEPSLFFTMKFRERQSFVMLRHLKTYREQCRAHGTIEILGLNRPGLVKERSSHLLKAGLALKGFLRTAEEFNRAVILLGTVPSKADMNSMRLLEEKMGNDWNDFFDLYLSSPDLPFIHATICYVDSELRRFGLNLKDLAGSHNLYIDSSLLSCSSPQTN